MRRKWLAWLVSVPLMVAGSISAHGLAYQVVAPSPEARSDLLHATGHGYLEHVPLGLGILGALLAAGLVLRALSAVHGGARTRFPAAPLFCLPLVAFTLQEHIERLVHTGSFPFDAVLEPTFLVGLALQLPFALAALVVAHALLDVAARVGSAVAARRPLPRPARHPALRPEPVAVPRIPVLALCHAGRGPPPSLP